MTSSGAQAGSGALPFTILDEGRPTPVVARLEAAAVWLESAALTAALGWELKPQGLCRGPVCIPVPVRADLVQGTAINALALAEVLGRPCALDEEARALYVGAAAQERASRLASLQAPEFTLHELGGKPVTLSQFRGRKVLLAAYASW